MAKSGAHILRFQGRYREEFLTQTSLHARLSIHRTSPDGPSAELVKIDLKSTGVGQHQHDVDQAALKRSLTTW
jgi:uncharacterized protein